MHLKRRLDGDVSRSWFFLRTWLPNHLDHFQSQRSISLKLRSNILRFDNICLFFPVSKSLHKLSKCQNCQELLKNTDSTAFVPPGNRTIEKTVLFGDWFCTKLTIYDFWIFKVPIFAHFQAILIFETRKVIIWFHFETFIKLFITNSDIFTRF